METILEPLGATFGGEVREWFGARTIQEAWAECARPEVLLWVHARSDSADSAAYAGLAQKWAGWAVSSDDAKSAARSARGAADQQASKESTEAWLLAHKEGALHEPAERWRAEWNAADAAWNAARARLCSDIRAALCCPVFNTPETAGKIPPR